MGLHFVVVQHRSQAQRVVFESFVCVGVVILLVLMRQARAGVEVAGENDDWLALEGVLLGEGGGQAVDVTQQLADLAGAEPFSFGTFRRLSLLLLLIE